MFDIVLRGGEVVDGTGRPPTRADVAIRDGRIVAVGDLRSTEAHRTLEVEGRVVCPGFIDAHGHSDYGLFSHPPAESQLAQGITTELVGTCGTSAFPVSAVTPHQVFFPKQLEPEWTSATEYFAALRRRRPAINVASLVGHSAVRGAVMGLEDRQPTAAELDRMREVVAEALRAGALGLSSGLHFEPSCFADTAELIELSRVVAANGGIYFAHLRDYGRDLLPSIDETIAIAQASGVRAHIGLLHVFGRPNWGQAPAALDRLDAAGARGLAITCDTLAYPTVGAWWALRAIFPPDVYDWQRGNLDELLVHLADSTERQRLASVVEERRRAVKRGFNKEYLIFSDWRDVTIEGVAPDSPRQGLLGRSVAAIAEELGVRPVECFFDLLALERQWLVAIHSTVDEAGLEAFIASPLSCLGVDAISPSARHLAGPLGLFQQYPRHWGTFPHILGTYVRARSLLSLPEAIRKMSALPAQLLGLADRGLVREGYRADLVVFDPVTIEAGGDWREPTRYPRGIDYVLVNGALAVEQGQPTGVAVGHVLTRSTTRTLAASQV